MILLLLLWSRVLILLLLLWSRVLIVLVMLVMLVMLMIRCRTSTWSSACMPGVLLLLRGRRVVHMGPLGRFCMPAMVLLLLLRGRRVVHMGPLGRFCIPAMVLLLLLQLPCGVEAVAVVVVVIMWCPRTKRSPDSLGT